MSKVEARLKQMGLSLPPPAMSVASYIPYTISGSLVVISGQIPLEDSKPKFIGKVGVDISLADAKTAAQLCALNMVTHLKVACGGNLDQVKRCLRLGVFVNCTPEFAHHPEVANGASDLIVQLFLENGRHARAAVGANSLPRGVAVEVEGLFEIS